mgnify:CR=1 FL=1
MNQKMIWGFSLWKKEKSIKYIIRKLKILIWKNIELEKLKFLKKKYWIRNKKIAKKWKNRKKNEKFVK